MEKIKKGKAKAAAYSTGQNALPGNRQDTSIARPQFIPIVKDFDYKEFKKIADRVSFTQKEWSDILHISERTLQRYAKDNSVFGFNVVDRILQIDKVAKRGAEVFGSMEKFINWLKGGSSMLEGRLSIHSLASFEGINSILTQLGRIEHGILA